MIDNIVNINKEIMDLLVIVIGMLLIVAMGAGMLFIVRWSRYKNLELKAKSDASQSTALKVIINQNDLKGAAKVYFTGTLSDMESNIGRALTVIAIIICLVFLVIASIVLVKLM